MKLSKEGLRSIGALISFLLRWCHRLQGGRNLAWMWCKTRAHPKSLSETTLCECLRVGPVVSSHRQYSPITWKSRLVVTKNHSTTLPHILSIKIDRAARCHLIFQILTVYREVVTNSHPKILCNFQFKIWFSAGKKINLGKLIHREILIFKMPKMWKSSCSLTMTDTFSKTGSSQSRPHQT